MDIEDEKVEAKLKALKGAVVSNVGIVSDGGKIVSFTIWFDGDQRWVHWDKQEGKSAITVEE
jgi:hypothetical protein